MCDVPDPADNPEGRETRHDRRMRIHAALCGLSPPSLLNRIMLAVNMPSDIRPSIYLEDTERCRNVVEWADSPTGCGLDALEKTLPPGLVRGAAAFSIAALETDAERLFDRESERKTLFQCWEQSLGRPVTHVVVQGFGGMGKSALLFAWASRLVEQRSAEQVFGWSFRRRDDKTHQSAEEFFQAAERFFLGPLGSLGDENPVSRAWTLAHNLRSRRALLVLDGLETFLQPTDRGWELTDESLRILLRELARENQGLVVVSTRHEPLDLECYRKWGVRVPLSGLLEGDSVAMLDQLGVKGSVEEMKALAQAAKGEPLTLWVTAHYIVRALDGNAAGVDKVILRAAMKRDGAAIRNVMQEYAAWIMQQEFGDERLAWMELVSFFDQSVDGELLDVFRRQPIPGLTEPLANLSRGDAMHSLNRLVKDFGLISRDAQKHYNTHEMVRAYFAESVMYEKPQAWRAGHAFLEEHWRGVVQDLCRVREAKEAPTTSETGASSRDVDQPRFPRTPEEMTILFRAVRHSCLAGHHVQALQQLLWDLILREEEKDRLYALDQLRMWDATLASLSQFFQSQ